MVRLVCVLCLLLAIKPASLQDFFDCESQKLELVFLQDASYSVSERSFQQAKNFIADTAQQLPIGHDRIRVALVRFGTGADVISKLSESSDVRAVTDAVEGMEYVIGGTNTALALRVVREKVLRDAREDARSVVVVITDGASNSFRKTRVESQKLRDQHVRLVWLYIASRDSGGLGREREGMMRKGDTTLGVSSFDDLGVETMRQILNASCEEFPEPTTIAPEEETTTTATTTTTAAPSEITPDASESANPDFGSGETISSSLQPILPSESKKKSSPLPAENVTKPSAESTQTSITSSDMTPQEAQKPSLDTTEKYQGDFIRGGKFRGADFKPIKTSESATTVISYEETPHTTEEPDNGSKFQSTDSLYNATTGAPNKTTNDNSSTAQPGFTVTQGAEERASKTRVEGEGGGGSWKNSLPKVVGTVVGVFAAAAIASGIVFLLRRRRERRRDKRDIETNKA